MEGGTFSQSEFSKLGDHAILFCHVTSHVKDEPEPNLLQEKGGSGFPTIVYMDGTGEVLYRHQGARSVEGFLESGQIVADFLSLKAKVDEGDEEAKLPFFLKRLELGHLSYSEAKRASSKLKGITDEQKGTIEQALFDLQIVEAYVSPSKSKSKASKLGRTWFGYAMKDRVPKSATASRVFWSLVHFYGEDQKNPKAIELAEKHR